jgi:hypothetical protein
MLKAVLDKLIFESFFLKNCKLGSERMLAGSALREARPA